MQIERKTITSLRGKKTTTWKIEEYTRTCARSHIILLNTVAPLKLYNCTNYKAMFFLLSVVFAIFIVIVVVICMLLFIFPFSDICCT